jgi:uncharacterized protein
VNLFFISAALHAYVGWRLLPQLAGAPLGWTVLLVVLIASAVLMPMGLVARRYAKPPLADHLMLAGLLFMGLFSSLFVLTVLRDVMLLALWGVAAVMPQAMDHARLTFWSAVAVPVVGVLVTLVGFLNARCTAAVVKVDVPIDGLPAALQGFTIAQLSDIHVGPTIKAKYLRRIVDKVNALDAGMVAITGDLIDGKVPELRDHVAPLAELQSKHGTFFVTGNHEYYSGAHEWIAELKRLGIRVLMNEHEVLAHGGAQLVVAGIADYSAHLFDPSHRSDAVKAVAGAPAGAPKVLLAHQPRSAPEAQKAGVDLQLSGHTHGGQFWPWNHFVRFQQPFTAGLNRFGKLWVYTSRGTGYWGPPKRFGAPSEITLLRLVAS